MSSTAEAYAPAAISNFFTISDAPTGRLTRRSDLRAVGALGGGFMLSKGVRSRVRCERVGGRSKVGNIVVDGDAGYDAKTTRTAAEMLLESSGIEGCLVEISQTMEVPVGQGFGASAAAALSAVNALALALDLGKSPAEVAYFAHAADILCRTGLGTVSVTYKYGGAGIIVKAGAPGVAKVRKVAVPRGMRVVTASLAPYSKGRLLSSASLKAKVNRLGMKALASSADLRLESLVKAGEVFASGLGLESEDISRLISVAKSAGAIGASQNMVGQALHAIVRHGDERDVVRALRSDALKPQVGSYEFGKGTAF